MAPDEYEDEDENEYETYAAPSRSIFARARSWYGRFERPISSFSLIGGFVFDALTLRRVDLFWDNVWVVGHLIIVTICAIWINLLDDTADESGVRPEANPQKLHFWLVNVMQFFFGGILSTYLVFYFRSGTFATSWPFLLILATAFAANESLKRSYARVAFQFSLLFLAYYAFAIYLMPILFHSIGTVIFLISGLASLAAIRIVSLTLAPLWRGRFAGRSRRLTVFFIGCIFLGVNTLYFLKFIPPLPLSLDDAAVYNSLTVNGPGNYTVTYEDNDSFLSRVVRFFKNGETIHIVPGDALYAYTAVFSPTSLNTGIIHEWQYYDAASNTWKTQGRIPLSVVGGRTGGYRTFSTKSTAKAGSWRVNVETPDGRVIGQLRFEVVTVAAEPEMKTVTIE